MVNKRDKKIYFPKSFNEQMSWIYEAIEHIIKHGKIKKDIQERGRAAYGKQGYTHAIHRLFEIIKYFILLLSRKILSYLQDADTQVFHLESYTHNQLLYYDLPDKYNPDEDYF